jgi:hypothetical protein
MWLDLMDSLKVLDPEGPIREKADFLIDHELLQDGWSAQIKQWLGCGS